MNWEWREAEDVLSVLSGAQIVGVQIEGSQGLHIRLLDERVLVIVGMPALGISIIQPGRSLH